MNSDKGKTVLIRIGSLWSNTSSKGHKYLGGKVSIETKLYPNDKILVFYNKERQYPTSPTHSLFVERPVGEPEPSPSYEGVEPLENPLDAKAGNKNKPPDDGIPF
jgi:hypothetical protein